MVKGRLIKRIHGYHVGQHVVVCLPPWDDREVVKIVLIASKDGEPRFHVEDEDGVRCWIGRDRIERRA